MNTDLNLSQELDAVQKLHRRLSLRTAASRSKSARSSVRCCQVRFGPPERPFARLGHGRAHSVSINAFRATS